MRSALTRRERGAVAVEFALVLPVLLLILLGIIDFGRVMFVKNALANAASQGARVAAMHLPSDSATAVTLSVAGSMGIQGMAGSSTPVSVHVDICPDTVTITTPLIDTVTASVHFKWITPASLFAPTSDTISATATWLCVFTN